MMGPFAAALFGWCILTFILPGVHGQGAPRVDLTVPPVLFAGTQYSEFNITAQVVTEETGTEPPPTATYIFTINDTAVYTYENKDTSSPVYHLIEAPGYTTDNSTVLTQYTVFCEVVDSEQQTVATASRTFLVVRPFLPRFNEISFARGLYSAEARTPFQPSTTSGKPGNTVVALGSAVQDSEQLLSGQGEAEVLYIFNQGQKIPMARTEISDAVGQTSISIFVGQAKIWTVSSLPSAAVLPPYHVVCNENQCSNSVPLAVTVEVTTQFVSSNLQEQVVTATKKYSCPGDCGLKSFGVIYYKPQDPTCSGYVTDEEVCMKPETAYLCAFGEGRDCTRCPEGALCPGGYIAIPYAGYWAASADTGAIKGCPPPSAIRCTGWDSEVNAVKCGPGYDPNVPMCAACLSGFYDEDGFCKQCPQGSTAVEIALVPLIIMISLALLFCVVLFLEIRSVFKRRSLPVKLFTILKLALSVGVWTMLNFQLLAQVVRTSSPGLPSWTRQVFNAIRIVQVDLGGVAPPQCESSSPYIRPAMILLVVLGCFIFLAVLFTPKLQKRLHCGKCARVLGLLLRVSVLAYPLAVNTSLAMFNCIEAVDKTGAIVSVWAENPHYECTTGEHIGVGVVAFIVLLVVGLGEPLLLLIVGRRMAYAVLLTEEAKTLAEGKGKGKGKGGSNNGSLPLSNQVETMHGNPMFAHAAGQSSTSSVTNSEPKHVKLALGIQRSKRGLTEEDYDELKRMSRCAVCPAWCALRRDDQEKLVNDPNYGPIFQLGQPWYQPTALLIFLWLGCVDILISSPNFTVRIAKTLFVATTMILSSLLVAILPGEINWSMWKRWPKFYISCLTAVVAFLQLSLTVDERDTTLVALEELQTTGASTVTNISIGGLTLFLVYLVIILACVVPLFTLYLFSRWLLRLVGSRLILCSKKAKQARVEGEPLPVFWKLLGNQAAGPKGKEQSATSKPPAGETPTSPMSMAFSEGKEEVEEETGELQTETKDPEAVQGTGVTEEDEANAELSQDEQHSPMNEERVQLDHEEGREERAVEAGDVEEEEEGVERKAGGVEGEDVEEEDIEEEGAEGGDIGEEEREESEEKNDAAHPHNPSESSRPAEYSNGDEGLGCNEPGFEGNYGDSDVGIMESVDFQFAPAHRNLEAEGQHQGSAHEEEEHSSSLHESAERHSPQQSPASAVALESGAKDSSTPSQPLSADVSPVSDQPGAAEEKSAPAVTQSQPAHSHSVLDTVDVASEESDSNSVGLPDFGLPVSPSSAGQASQGSAFPLPVGDIKMTFRPSSRSLRSANSSNSLSPHGKRR